MKIEEFVESCNKSPLFVKKHRVRITEDILKEFSFVREAYEIDDLVELSNQLDTFILSEEPEELSLIYPKKDRSKYLRHLDLIKRLYNQKFIIKCRRELKIPYANRGFKVIFGKKKILPLENNFTNIHFNWIEPAFKDWLFSYAVETEYVDDYDKWKKTSMIVLEKVNKVVNEILDKWELPGRYKDAISELLLFNRIIPAKSGICWKYVRGKDGLFEEGIFWEKDVLKSDLIKNVKQIFRTKKGIKRYGTPRKSEETQKLIELYNSIKKDGKRDKEVFEIIHRDYHKNLSVRAIAKRIKGK